PLLRSSGKDQRRASMTMRNRQIWTHRESSLNLRQRIVGLAACLQGPAKARTGFGIGTIERDRPAGQGLRRALRVSPANLLVERGRLQLVQSERAIAAAEGRVEIDRLSEEVLCALIVLCGRFAQMPQAALIGCPGIKTARRPTHG